MPSSHAAGVMSLSTTVGLICGWESIEFAMAFGYAGGVRTGRIFADPRGEVA